MDKEGNIKTGEEAEKLATTSAAVYAGSIDTVRRCTCLPHDIALISEYRPWPFSPCSSC